MIGEISDEDDVRSPVRRLRDGRLVADADTLLSELAADGVHLKSVARSLAELIQDELGAVPKRGEEVTIGGYTARVPRSTAHGCGGSSSPPPRPIARARAPARALTTGSSPGSIRRCRIA